MEHQNGLGQVPHNFTGDLDKVDHGFARVDMNPQFVMMAYRDFFWTGDKEYLAALWPHLVQAIAFTASLDTDGDGLPDAEQVCRPTTKGECAGRLRILHRCGLGAARGGENGRGDGQAREGWVLVGVARQSVGELR